MKDAPCRHLGAKRIGGCCGTVTPSRDMWICRLVKQGDGMPQNCVADGAAANDGVESYLTCSRYDGIRSSLDLEKS